MSEEMAMFWFGLSALIGLWGLSQYTPRQSPRLYSLGNLTAFSKGLIEGLNTKEADGQ